jgi:hypothetical protein
MSDHLAEHFCEISLNTPPCDPHDPFPRRDACQRPRTGTSKSCQYQSPCRFVFLRQKFFCGRFVPFSQPSQPVPIRTLHNFFEFRSISGCTFLALLMSPWLQFTFNSGTSPFSKTVQPNLLGFEISISLLVLVLSSSI